MLCCAVLCCGPVLISSVVRGLWNFRDGSGLGFLKDGKCRMCCMDGWIRIRRWIARSG